MSEQPIPSPLLRLPAQFDPALFADRRLGPDDRVPRLSDYFGPWSIEPRFFQAAVQRFNNLDLQFHIQQRALPALGHGAGAGRGYSGGVAVIELVGTLMKSPSSLGESTSTIAVRRAIRMAAADDGVAAIVLRFDSPGGTTAGTADLAGDVAAAARQKPVYGYCEDLCASAAYWVACACTKIYANPTCLVGGVGSYMVIEDSSQRAENEGIKVHVVRAGEFKGAGVKGTAATPEQLAYCQKTIDGLNEHFLKAVANGRRLSLDFVRDAIADGRVHSAAAALKLNLIDGIQSLDATIASLSKNRSPQMSAHNSSASFEEIKAACQGCDAEFVCAQLESGATIDDARQAWMAEQNRRLAEARNETNQLRADGDPPADGKKKKKFVPGHKDKPGDSPGTSPDEDEEEKDDEGTDDEEIDTKFPNAESAWNEAIQAELSRLPTRLKARDPAAAMQRAALAVERKLPGLRRAFIRQYNRDNLPLRQQLAKLQPPR